MSKPLKRSGPRREKEKAEYSQEVIDVARVVRVVAGGRRFSFRAVVALGNQRGRVGVGVAKGADVSAAIEKAAAQAKKNFIDVTLKDTTIPHEVSAKYGAAKVILKPAKKGKGLVAGGVMRLICSLAGISDLTGKVISRSTNKLNNARATIEALKKL